MNIRWLIQEHFMINQRISQTTKGHTYWLAGFISYSDPLAVVTNCFLIAKDLQLLNFTTSSPSQICHT